MPCRWCIDECSTDRVAGWIDNDGPVDAIEIAINGHAIATFSPTDYRKDLEDAGIGDGRRSFTFAISRYLVEPVNVIAISCGGQVLHSETLRLTSTEARVSAILRTTSDHRDEAGGILFLQTADPQKYRILLKITSQTVTEYCGRHNFSYQTFLGICRGYHAWQATFNRILLLRRIVNDGFAGWVCYLDADAFIADLDFDLAGYLSDKSHIALIAATDRPHDPDRPYWLINAGAFFINLGSPVGRKIIWDWAEQFDAITDEQLQAAVEWGQVVDDQSMLQRILYQVPGGSEVILTQRGEPNLINYHTGIFIRQILRGHGSFEERIELLRSETDRVLGLS